MRLKRILSLILTACIITSNFSSVVQISAQTEEGTSIQAAQLTAAEEIAVQTASRPVEPTEEFVVISVDDFVKFMTEPEHWGSSVKVNLTCDIDMKGKAFNSIKEFGGVFDGCGHTISNIKIKNKSDKSKNSEIAFINTLNEFAEIKNVTLDNYTVAGKSGIKKAAGFIITNHGTVSGVDILNGSINGIDKKTKTTGFAFNNEEDGVIENCHVGNMSVKDSNIRSGFVGTNYGRIKNSNTTLSVNSKDVAGGFVGENSGTIEKCNSKGDVESKKCAGGFCANNSGEITSCTSEGNVKAKTKSTKVVTICGGFVGENSGIIKDCSSAGKVEGQEFTGGFVGINNDKGEISSCKTTCDVKSHTYVASIYCGGFAGLDAGKIEKCNFDGNVDGRVDSDKVFGGVVAAIVSAVVIGAILYLMVKYIKDRPDLKRDAEEIRNNAKNELDTAENAFNEIKNTHNPQVVEIEYEANKTKLNDEYVKKTQSSALKRQKHEIDQKGYIKMQDDILINHINNTKRINNEKNKKLDEYKLKKEQYDIAKNKYAIVENIGYQTIKGFIDNNFVISLLAGASIGVGALGATASGVAIRSTVGRKCENLGAFVGFNAGEIIKCSANSGSIKTKTLYNKYTLCGGFVGTNSGTIKDSDATGNEICNEKYTGGSLGGFVGENIGKIENGTTNISVANGKCAGGFCGSNSGEITNSKSKGNATADAKTLTNKTKCGGFVGNNNEKGKIDDCTSSGSVAGQEYVGGFCGDNSGEVSKSKSSGDATSKTVSNTSICGGFVGNNDEKGNIDGCTSTGSATGEEYVGGFVGVNKSDIIDCNAHGKATSSTKTHTALAGGFVGENERGTIISCTATGGADSQSSSGQAKAGGFVGVNKANIMNSKASGYVYLSAGTCHKDDGCGGFVGKNDKGGSIDGCYAEATVETTNKKKGGGFVGEALNKSTINNSTCKTKIIKKSGIRKQTKFYEHKDKKAVIENCYAN